MIRLRGFTLIELIVIMGILAILATIVVIAVNPARQFAASRNAKRSSDTRALQVALDQYASNNNGIVYSGITTTPQLIGTSNLDLTSTLVPNYLSAIPADPTSGTAANTRYVVFKDSSERVSVVAPLAEQGRTIGYGAGPNTAAKFTSSSSESLSIGDNTSITIGGTDFTFTGWFYADSLSTTIPIFSKSSEYMLWYEAPPGALRWLVWEGNANIRTAQSATSLTANTWYFFEASYVESTKVISIKVNNGTAATFTMPTVPAPKGSSFYLGNYQNLAFHNGRIDNVGFWKRALTTQEATDLYNAGRGLNYSQLSSTLKTNLISYWNLDEDTGIRKDHHGTNNLTDNNTVTIMPGI